MDVDAIRILRQAGLVLALVDEPPEHGARVLAITEKGTSELLRYHYPESAKRQGTRSNWLQIAADRAREVIGHAGRSDNH